MEGYTEENGSMESNTEREYITHLRVRSDVASGKKGRELDGSPMRRTEIKEFTYLNFILLKE